MTTSGRRGRKIDPRPAVVAEALTPADVRAAVLTPGSTTCRSPSRRPGTARWSVRRRPAAEDVADGGGAGRSRAPDRTGRTGSTLGRGDRRRSPVRARADLRQLAERRHTGYTLGGGFGWLSRKHGFAADSLLRVDIVTADGRSVTASRDRNADLFWAIRGGGANFGVVTALEFQLYPVAQVYAGTALFPIARATEVLARYRDWAAGSSRTS